MSGGLLKSIFSKLYSFPVIPEWQSGWRWKVSLFHSLLRQSSCMGLGSAGPTSTLRAFCAKLLSSGLAPSAGAWDDYPAGTGLCTVTCWS